MIRPSMEARNWILSVIVGAAPLLGILGTVVGIIESFDLLGQAAGVSDPTIVAGGIAEALYTTASGLTIALLALFPAAYFKARANTSLSRLDNQLDRLRIHRLKVHWCRGATYCESGGGDAVTLSVRDGEAVADSSGSGLFSRPYGIFECFGLFYFVVFSEEINELVDRVLLVLRLKRRADAFNAEDV
ncbi:unnamed protein product [Symbiodinium sp. CCMP2592]|nr:unnamed protein product [Symbiodinium sp. CCMP2592]